MSQLHVFSSLDSFIQGRNALAHLTPEDAVLLRGDALYQLLNEAEFAAGSYALEPDALARGLDPEQFPHLQWISYEAWVDLAIETASSIDW